MADETITRQVSERYARALATGEQMCCPTSYNFEDLHPNLTVLPHWTVTSIAVVPGGSHPSYTHGYYERDNASYLEWDEIAADRARFRQWMEENVLNSAPEAFAERVEALRVAA